MSLLALAGVAFALGGLTATDRLSGRLGVSTGGATDLRGHAFKWVPAGLLVGYVLLVEGRPLASLGWRLPPSAPLGAVTLAPASVALAAVGGGYLLTVLAGAAVDGVLAWLDVAVEDGMVGRFAELSVPGRLFVALTAGVVEELLFHGYAIERLLELTGSPLVAGLLSFGAFTLAHLGDTWGPAAVARIAAPALATTLLYLAVRSLPVLIAVHVLVDATGLLLADRYADG